MRTFLLLFCAFFVAGCAGRRMHVTGEVSWTLLEDKAAGQLQLMLLNDPEPLKEIVLRENVTFQLYTRSNSVEGYRLYLNESDNLDASDFNPQLPTKILAHGWNSDLSDGTIQSNKRSYLTREDCNVIGVGYGPLVSGLLYNVAKQNALLVGRYLGEFVNYLVATSGASLDDFHLTGHSLGAQVMGVAGNSVVDGQVSRITALDAAWPLFGGEVDENRLDPSDAVLVDAIHSDGGELGFMAAIGHVDFYPNGGRAPQPECGFDPLGGCSHGMSVSWFIESVSNLTAYPAVQCDSAEEAAAGNCSSSVQGWMGDGIGDTPHGIYYLETMQRPDMD